MTIIKSSVKDVSKEKMTTTVTDRGCSRDTIDKSMVVVADSNNKLATRHNHLKLSGHLKSLLDTIDKTDPNSWKSDAVNAAQAVVDLLGKIDFTDEEKSVFISRGAFYLKNPSPELFAAVDKLEKRYDVMNHVFELHVFRAELHRKPSILVAPIRIDTRRD